MRVERGRERAPVRVSESCLKSCIAFVMQHVEALNVRTADFSPPTDETEADEKPDCFKSDTFC